MQNRIFSTDSAKAAKAAGFGYLNAIHYMAPATMAGVGNLCSHATPSCIAACLGLTSGQAGMVKDIESNAPQGNSVRQSRIEKAVRFMRDRKAYVSDIVRSIETLERKAQRDGLSLCVRLNGSTDIAWEGITCERGGVAYRNIFDAFPHIQFVDYTKNHMRLGRKLPTNYHLTLSRHELNEPQALAAVTMGHNVAVVFDKLPATYQGHVVIDGDKHDLRHLDPKGVIVGLTPKGRKAKRDISGFVVRIAA